MNVRGQMAEAMFKAGQNLERERIRQVIESHRETCMQDVCCIWLWEDELKGETRADTDDA